LKGDGASTIVDAPSPHPDFVMTSTSSRTLGGISLGIAVAMCAAVAPGGASAQPPIAANHSQACDPLINTEITFGQTGGSIRPAGLRVDRDGIVTRARDRVSGSTPVATVSPDAVRGIVRLAWTNGFPTLPTAPTRPTRNPDAARDFVELHSPCGNKHVEYATGEGAPAFRELFALLTALTASIRSTR
jgi:hypothetical protein